MKVPVVKVFGTQSVFPELRSLLLELSILSFLFVLLIVLHLTFPDLLYMNYQNLSSPAVPWVINAICEYSTYIFGLLLILIALDLSLLFSHLLLIWKFLLGAWL